MGGAFPRIFNRTVTFDRIDNGVLTATDDPPVDMTEALEQLDPGQLTDGRGRPVRPARPRASARSYSLASQGLMVVYRGSGVLNFAHGAIGMVGAYVAWEVRDQHGQPFVVALIAGVTGVGAARRPHPPPRHAPAAPGVAARPHRGDARRAHPAAAASP